MADYSDLGFQPAAKTPAPAAAPHADLGFTPAAQPAAGGAPIVAPGAADDDIIRSYGFDPAVIKASPAYQQAAKEHGGSGLAFMFTDPNRKDIIARVANSRGGDMGQGLIDLVAGASQLTRHVLGKVGLTDERDTPYGDLLIRLQNQDYLQNVRHGNASPLFRMLGSAVAPVPGGALVKGEGALANIGRAAVTGAAGAAMMPVTEGDPNDFVGEKLKQATTGAVVGGGTGAALVGVGKVGAKVINAARGRMSPEAAAVIAAGERAGVRTTYGDISGNPVAQKTEVALESVPVVGMSGVRAKQSAEAKAAAEGLAAKLHEKFLDTDPEAFADVVEAAAGGDQRAKGLIEKLQNAGNDPDKVLQASIGLADFRTRDTARALYDTVEKLSGDAQVEMPATSAAIKRAIAEAKQAKLPKKEVIGVLEEIQRNISPKKPFEQKPGATIDYGNASTRRNAGGAAEGASVSAPNGGGTEAAGGGQYGSDTTVRVPGETRGYQARYGLRELEDVQPSHSGETFQPNPNYKLRNDRDYSKAENQGKVVTWATPSEFEPGYHVSDNVDAVNGPIVIDSEGHALGGNGRAMILQRVYGSNPKGSQAYRDLLEQKAAQFGLDPAEVRAMKRPVLVREIADAEFGGAATSSTGSKQTAITAFNKKGTAELTPAEKAIADSRGVSPETLDHVAGRLEAKGPDATLSEVLDGPGGVDVLRNLVHDGVISPQEQAAYVSGGALTPDAKNRISRLMLGRFFRDPAQLDRVAPSVRGKLERIAAPLSQIEGKPGWDLGPDVQGALDLLEEAQAHGTHNIDEHLAQKGLLGNQEYSPRAVELAKHLQATNPNDLTKAVRQYASDSNVGDMFGNAPTPRESFRDAFGADVPEEVVQPKAAAATAAAGAPAPAPSSAPPPAAASAPRPRVAPPTEIPADNRYGLIRGLRSDLGDMIRTYHQGGNALIGERGSEILQRVQNSLEDDLTNHASKSGKPELQAAGKTADEYYKTARVPFKDGMLAQAAVTTEPDQIFNQFIKAGKGDRAQKFYDALDEKGKASVRYNMVAEAVNKATDPAKGIFSPQKFFTAMDKISEPYGVFFKGADRMEIDGFKNLMAHVTRAGQYAENPPTGQRMIQAAAGVGTIASPVLAAKVAATSALARVLLTSSAGKKFLLASSSLQPGSKAMEDLLQRIMRTVPAAAAKLANQPQ